MKTTNAKADSNITAKTNSDHDYNHASEHFYIANVKYRTS